MVSQKRVLHFREDDYAELKINGVVHSALEIWPQKICGVIHDLQAAEQRVTSFIESYFSSEASNSNGSSAKIQEQGMAFLTRHPLCAC